ncbi:Hypp1670 [Branchiostoma lanceolatum]|uniref:Hypp1670 protein n=1 Tax=Branchiostoma lanceolatum TaxID=7740 RepID=A0A8J9ZJI7_BRALA|nr:Hypp1670 [Branchiostoma lanceolatum]
MSLPEREGSATVIYQAEPQSGRECDNQKYGRAPDLSRVAMVTYATTGRSNRAGQDGDHNYTDLSSDGGTGCGTEESRQGARNQDYEPRAEWGGGDTEFATSAKLTWGDKGDDRNQRHNNTDAPLATNDTQSDENGVQDKKANPNDHTYERCSEGDPENHTYNWRSQATGDGPENHTNNRCSEGNPENHTYKNHAYKCSEGDRESRTYNQGQATEDGLENHTNNRCSEGDSENHTSEGDPESHTNNRCSEGDSQNHPYMPMRSLDATEGSTPHSDQQEQVERRVPNRSSEQSTQHQPSGRRSSAEAVEDKAEDHGRRTFLARIQQAVKRSRVLLAVTAALITAVVVTVVFVTIFSTSRPQATQTQGSMPLDPLESSCLRHSSRACVAGPSDSEKTPPPNKILATGMRQVLQS